jgi:hypothetical protein
MYRQSGQGQVRFQPNPVAMDDRARRSGLIVLSGGTGSSGRWSWVWWLCHITQNTGGTGSVRCTPAISVKYVTSNRHRNVPHRHHGLRAKSSPTKTPSPQQGDEVYANAREMRSLQAPTKVQKMPPKPSRSHTCQANFRQYARDTSISRRPCSSARKQKASRIEEQIKEQLLKRSVDAKEKRKNFTDEERKRESARTMENRRKRKARWNSEERAENRTKEAATEKIGRDGWSDEHCEEVLLKTQN